MQHPIEKLESDAVKYARKSLILMNEYKIEPKPVNYSVWYHYVCGDIPRLNQEIDQFIKTKNVSISDDVNIYLYNKYLTESLRKNEQALQNSSENAQTVLGEIMAVIEKFSGDTRNYNTQIDEHVNTLSKNINNPAISTIAREIINRAVSIRDSGFALQDSLEASKSEVELLKTSLEKVTSEASKDFLTGIGNRKAFESNLEAMTKHAIETKGDLCLLMIDIDHFKQFNDKYGHLIGDEVIKKVARTLFDTVKGKDFVARYGGEEFAVLLPDTSRGNALVVAENIRRNMHETRFQRKDTKEFIDEVTVSIGVAQYRLLQDSTAMFISRADDALYRSKRGGRNKVTIESF